MQFIVWNRVNNQIIKFGDNKGKLYDRIVFKGMDDNKTYTLNIPHSYKTYKSWNDICIAGAIVDANLQANKKNINYFMPFKLLKGVNNE